MRPAKSEAGCSEHAATKLVRFVVPCLLVLAGALAPGLAYAQADAPAGRPGPIRQNALRYVRTFDFEAIRLAITDLAETFGPKYPDSPSYLGCLDKLAKVSKAALDSFDPNDSSAQADIQKLAKELDELRYDALLANPLLDFDKLLLLKRKRGQLGLPVNHKCNSGIERTGYDNEIAILKIARPGDSPLGPLGGRLQTLYRPAGTEFVGEMDLDFDGDRLLFTMPKGPIWQIFEIKTDGAGLRQVSRGEHPDVDNFDACYLPDGRIVFASTASYTAVPCWHGIERACNIYLMDADGGHVRQLCFDQDLDLHPAVLPTGQVIFSRWDYTGPMHIYLRPLMVMNPDGTGQRAVYGSNSYWPNALYFPRGIPGSPGEIVAIIAGYHGVPRMGELGLFDTTKGWHEASGIVQRIPGRGKPVQPVIRDNLVDKSWPKFLHPYPLSNKYFLVASQPDNKSSWGIYLVDVFDNMLPLIVQPKFDFFEPIPLAKTQRPPVIPDRVDLGRDDAVVYINDVYAGPGLAGVPRGAVRRLRIVAYHFGYPGMAGPDNVGCGGPWEAMRILGTVDVQQDGSAKFTVPANTPLSVQPLDEEGKAVQLMRSWFTAMPGESVSCVGCHERPKNIPTLGQKIAATRPAQSIQPWYGPARGLDFERDVQPVLDEYCAGCHDGSTQQHGQSVIPRRAGNAGLDLRAERLVKDYQGRELTKLGAQRLHPVVREAFGGTKIKYTPAYEALIPYIRRVNVEDHVGLLVPGEYHADTSELIQMLRKGHHDVQLNQEAWDRLVTWIDLNGPCHGTWGDVGPIPDGAVQRRQELRRLYGGPKVDPEAIPQVPRPSFSVQRSAFGVQHATQNAARSMQHEFSVQHSQRRDTQTKTIDLGDGVTIKLVRIPAGRFVMGDTNGEPDEMPLAEAAIERDFWMAACEITNAQYHRFDPQHDSGYFTKRYQGPDGPGLSLAEPEQPAVRVSWQRAADFCRWLSQQSGMDFTLPTEAQWEYACRAGSQSSLSYGSVDADFSQWANVADQSLSVSPRPTGGLESNIVAHFGKGILESAVYGGNILCDIRFDDGAIATANAGRYQPNAWGLYDMHGNACEWTATTYEPYTGQADGEQDRLAEAGRKVVRGGSWCDRPKRCRSAFRLSYPPWQRVHNVGFRVVCRTEAAEQKYALQPVDIQHD